MTGAPGAIPVLAVTVPDPTISYLFFFLLSLVFVVCVTMVLRAHAVRLGLMDIPDQIRRVHDRPVARVGGLAIAVTVWLGMAIAIPLVGLETLAGSVGLAGLAPVLFGTTALAAVGLWDDRVELSPATKFLLQALVAAAVFAAGVRLGSFRLPVLGLIELDPFTSFAFTLLWFLGITNAFNLVDGADGVAGVAALAAIGAMFVVALVIGEPLIALLLAVTAGAVLGFLFFNFPPATVFLGDAGSLSLGFLLAGIGLVSSSKATTALALAIPIVSLGLPILDTVLAILRRMLRGDSVTSADLGHFHHHLIKLGHSPREVALISFAVCGVLAAASLILLTPDLRAVGVTLAAIGVTVFIAIQRLRIPELLELRRVVGRGIDQRKIIRRNVALREAASKLGRSGDLTMALGTLSNALAEAECETAELWLSSDLTGWLPDQQPPLPLKREGDGYVWSWGSDDASLNKCSHRPGVVCNCWEIRLPVQDPVSPETVGRLSMWRLPDGY
ncbi:MAG: MraY family glycosyltransferase, partial [Gemmatimonadota bacterium]